MQSPILNIIFPLVKKFILAYSNHLSTWKLEVSALEVTNCFRKHDIFQNNL